MAYQAIDQESALIDKVKIVSPQDPLRAHSRDHSEHVTDEVFNAGSHFVGATFSLLGLVILVVRSSVQGNPWAIVGFAIYGSSLVLLFVASFLHHGLSASEAVERRLRILDYAAIYSLIAGTFTPLCLVFMHNSWVGWSFLGVIWALAITGAVINVSYFDKIPKWLPLTTFVSMGWIGGLAAVPLFDYIGWGGISLLALGGIVYTAGGVIFITEKPNPVPGKFGFHEIWHVFVLVAAALHWLMMFCYVSPAAGEHRYGGHER